jgi:hypothetical protein
MKKQTFNSLGLTAAIGVPETVEEYDSLAGKPGACLESGVMNAVYRGRGGLADFRYYLVHGITEDDLKSEDNKGLFAVTSPVDGLEQTTKIERKWKDSLDKAGKPVVRDGETVQVPAESEDEYVKRVLVEKGGEVEQFQPIADGISAALILDPKARERKATGPKKLAARFKDFAGSLLSKGTFATFLSGMFVKETSKPAPAFTPTGDTSKIYTFTNPRTKETGEVSDKDAETLGWFVKEWETAKNNNDLANAVV